MFITCLAGVGLLMSGVGELYVTIVTVYILLSYARGGRRTALSKLVGSGFMSRMRKGPATLCILGGRGNTRTYIAG